MPILDARGRVFGKVNIIDAAVLLVVCLFIPLGYGAYLLFRTPQPRLIAVEPERVPEGTIEVKVRGEYLRPYLRATIGIEEATVLFETADSGVLRLPPLVPGSYDVVLYDEAQELGRLRRGLVIENPFYPERPKGAQVDLVAIGVFRGLDRARARTLWQDLRALDQRPMEWGNVAGLRSPEPSIEYVRPDALPVPDGTYEVRAVLRLQCTLLQSECKAGNVSIASDRAVPIRLQNGEAQFLIQELHPVYTSSVDVLLRAILPRDVVALLASGQYAAQDSFPARDALRPAVKSVDVEGEATEGDSTARVTLRVPVVRTSDGWIHRRRALKIGDQFTFEIPLYQVRGTIVGIRTPG